MPEQKKRNIIICSLCGILLLMVVGYAAFNTILNIEGTTSISSNWNILITKVEEKNKVGEASTVDEYPKWENLTATFQTNLVSPGDSIEYDITIENKGNLNAELARIKVSKNNNPAIKFTTTGLSEGDTLEASGSAKLTVKVEYSDEVTSQPDNLIANLTVKLDYVQQGHKSEWIPDDETASEMLIEKVTTQGDGLYSDTYEPGRYVYKGKSPNNYITFNNETAGWRIISVEEDGTIKIMKNISLGNRVFDTKNARTAGYCSYAYNGCNVWATTPSYNNNQSLTNGVIGQVSSDSSLKNYLNGAYYTSLNANKTAVDNHVFYYGPVTYNNTNLATQITAEKTYQVTQFIGLIAASDYLRANGNTSCNVNKYNNDNISTCQTTNWMYKTDQEFWTINAWYNSAVAQNDTSSSATTIDYAKIYAQWSGDERNVYPVLYLKSDTELEGEGTEREPYTIKNHIN